MCDPVSITAGIGAVGSVYKGVSAYQTAQTNAAALDTAAAQRQQKSNYDVEQANRSYERQEGTVRAQIGTTGTDVRSFSDVLDDDAKESALQKLAIKTGAQVDINNLKFQAAGQRTAGTQALIGGFIGAGTSVATGYGQQAKLDAIRNKGITLDSAEDPFG